MGTLANSEDSDEIPQIASFNQELHCLGNRKMIFPEWYTLLF